MKNKTTIPNGLTFYKTKTGFRWRIYRNGRKIGASTEAYKNLGDAEHNLESLNYFSDFSHRTAAKGEYKNRKK